jgi:asparagine synthase (glutamine-hydrolysing)
MSAFVGVVALHGTILDRHIQDRATAAITALRSGRIAVRRVEGAMFVYRGATDRTDSHDEPQPLEDPNRPLLFAALARVDNRNELGGVLGLAGTELARTPDAALLRLIYERFGDAGVARCLGAFSFAHWDGNTRRLTLGRDCLGNRALFYYRGSEFIAFASNLGTLLALPGVPRAIDELALANFLAVNFRDDHRTFYRGIERVRSRTLVTIDGHGCRQRHYWAPDLDAPAPYRHEHDYIERARELLDLAVAASTRDTPRFAIATSGGFDSSAIAATAARQGAAKSIACFCLVPPSGAAIDVGALRYFNERPKVEDLARMYPGLDIHFVAPDRMHPKAEDDTFFFVRASVPAFAPATFDASFFLRDAIDAGGYQTLLIGNAGNFGLTWNGRFSLVELLRSGQWRAFAHEWRAAARESDRGMARTFAGDVVMPTAPGRVRRLLYRMRSLDPDSVANHSALNPDFIAEAGLARQWRKQGFDPRFGAPDWNAKRWRAHRLFDHNQYGRDNRATARDIFGHEIRDPHADRRLLEFALAVPETMYRRDGVPRAFARRVLADRLPPSILGERRGGANTPMWFRSIDARRNAIAAEIERLDASPLARRLIDLPRLKRLITQWPKDENEAERHRGDYRLALASGVHVGRFIRWVEGGNV